MTETVKARSITSDHLTDLTKRINSLGCNPFEAVVGRANLIAELDRYISSPDCFVDAAAKAYAEAILGRL